MLQPICTISLIGLIALGIGHWRGAAEIPKGALEDAEKRLEGEEKVQKPIPVINLHPALPGAFDGAHAIERAYEAFQKGEIKHSGAMVHRVVREVDRGQPVIVQEVEIKPGEPIEAYEERLHKTEWEIIVKATAKILDEVAPVSVSM